MENGLMTVHQVNEKKYFKAFIRVVKSVAGMKDIYGNYSDFGTVEVVREPVILAKDKKEVKEYLLEKYPQFFQNGKIFEKETKDVAQFFYVLIYPLYNYEIDLINEGEWKCTQCGQIYENKYVERPRTANRLYGESVMFCKSDDDICYERYREERNKLSDFPDDEHYIKEDSLNYIYKITEKTTGKCYIGKTRNAPFFRWWNHLTRNGSPFGLYLRQTLLSDWTFEIIDILPSDISDSEIFKKESEYIIKFDSITNGFNTVISCKNIQ